MIGKIISHYQILEKLGEGGMGIVYKAQDTKLDRTVALKFLPQHLTSDPVERERFVHEAKAASALNHPNITTIHEIDEFEGQMFIVMEYCEGETLKTKVGRGQLAVRSVLDIAIQACEGLAMAHEKGIVHRDIKSDNIMLTPRGQVKIMDFGLAKLKGASRLTKTDSTVGTLAYMSPEQIQGEDVDQRSDIFSFGVALYELLTGHLPFEGEHQAAIVYSIINEEPQPIARFNNQVSAKLEDIVSKALAKEKDERYQHIDDLLADVRRERKSLEYMKTSQISKEALVSKPKKKILPIVIPASIVFILAVLFFIFKPFKVEIGPQKGAIAQENSLAIMYFENMVDPHDTDRMAQMITALLTTSLSEFPQYMQVMSSQRLYDILKLLGKGDVKIIDRTVASEVAKKAGVKWILTGKLLQTKPNIVLISEISEAVTGRILATQKVSGAAGEDLFTVVDELSPQVGKALSLPAEAKKELQKPVAGVTTHSQEAYRFYLEGVENLNKYYLPEAMVSFARAVELDSTFAMAYWYLAFANVMDYKNESAREFINKAARYKDKITQREKMYVRSMETNIAGNYAETIRILQEIVRQYPEDKAAYFGLGAISFRNLQNYNDAIQYMSKAIEIDPLYKVAYNTLAYCYNLVGDFEKSIWAINKYIELAPDEANPYDTRADLYAYNGKPDQAIESYRKALEKKPDFYMSLPKLGYMCLFKQEYARAESCFKELFSWNDGNVRSIGRSFLAVIPLYQGRLNRGLEILSDGLSADRMEQIGGTYNHWKYWLKASVYEERGELNLALREVETLLGLHGGGGTDSEATRPVRPYQAYLMAKSGNITKAEEIAQTLKKGIDQQDTTRMYNYWLALGGIEFAKGNAKVAVEYIEKPGYKEAMENQGLHYTFAEAYLDAGALDKAVALLERVLSTYDTNRAVDPISAVKAYYLLGMAYERSDWNDKAIEKYEEFLNIWKDADPGLTEVADAKARLAQLTAQE
ncbi:MAG: serine/threonine protein kinase [Geobacter sp.]|nr:MAG: serine/threonine protein kinase [Geobacter sp.]